MSLVGSGRVVSKVHYKDRTRHDQTIHVRSCDQISDKVWSVSNSTAWTHGLCVPTRPDPQTKSTHVEIERTSLRPDKVRGLVGDPSGPWVGSGRVRVVEFRNDTTRPDQRQSLAELTNVIWTDPVRTQQTLWETRVSNKVWPGPSSGTWTQQGRIVAGEFSLVQTGCVNTPSSVLPKIKHGRQSSILHLSTQAYLSPPMRRFEIHYKYTHTRLTDFFRHYPGEPVPER